jgi:hypothetical protein
MQEFSWGVHPGRVGHARRQIAIAILQQGLNPGRRAPGKSRRARPPISVRARTAHGHGAPSGTVPVTAGIRRQKGDGTMRLRKGMPAAVLGAALIMLALSALGGNSGPNFGDPLSGLTPDLQALFVAGQYRTGTLLNHPGDWAIWGTLPRAGSVDR